jgi:hypothetical protein
LRENDLRANFCKDGTKICVLSRNAGWSCEVGCILPNVTADQAKWLGCSSDSIFGWCFWSSATARSTWSLLLLSSFVSCSNKIISVLMKICS